MRYAGHEPAPGGSLTGRGSRSPWGHADGPGRMAPRQGPRRARQSHAGAAASPSARIEPGWEHLAISARELVVEPRVRLLRRHRRSLLRRLEPPHRPALAHHVHRPPGLGQCMTISAGWYDTPEAPFYSDDLLPALQGTLASLADLDIRHEIERDYLEEWSGPDEVKQRLMAALEARWQRDREPIVQRLTQLDEEIRAPRKAHRPESVRHKGRACSGRTRVERRSAA